MTPYSKKHRVSGLSGKTLRCRVIKWCIAIIVSLWTPTLAEDFYSTINYTHLIIHYISVCGTVSLCDLSFLTSLNLPLRGYPQRTGCPKCSCESSCLLDTSRYPCCPDLYFRNGAQFCRSIEVTDNKMDYYFFSVIDSCPTEADHMLIEECSKKREPAERLVLPPVSSKDNDMLFWNRYCAECRNVSDVQPWSLFFDCKNAIDFNYLSSYDEIIQTANKQDCSITFQSTFGRDCVPDNPQNLISQCNVTGNWKSYDFSIDSACRSTLDLAYKNVFKNVFCYICNPPFIAQHQLPKDFHCKDKKSPLQKLCDFFPRTDTLSEYKNIFCLLCSDHVSGEEYRVLSTFRRTTNSTEVRYNITISQTMIGQQYKLWNTSKAIGLKANSITNEVIPLTKTINSTHVSIKSFAFSGFKLCNSSILSEDIMDLGYFCSCEIGCTSSCCVDHALTHGVTSCINSAYPPEFIDNGGNSVIDKCSLSEANAYHAIHCNTSATNLTDILHALPVTDTQKARSYKNIFCFLCYVEKETLHSESVRDLILSKVLPWELFVVCKEFINPDYFPTLNNFMVILKAMKCKLNLKANPLTTPCENRKPKVSICNTTGLWLEEDGDIKRSCEDIEHGRLSLAGLDGKYKNIFCQMCNPVAKVAGDVITSCNRFATSSWVAACETLPYVQGSSPYKNHFCAKCNSYINRKMQFDMHSDYIEFSAPSFDDRHMQLDVDEIPYYRTMFALSAYDKHNEQQSGKSCLTDQQLNAFQGDCMNKTCFPGKILRNNSCVPLLEQTTNLRYVLYFWIKQEGNRSLPLELQTRRILIILQRSIIGKIISIAKLSQHPNQLDVEDASFHSNKPCHATNISSFKAYIQITIFIASRVTVNRTDVEMKLLNFSNSNHKFYLHDSYYEFSFTQDRYPRLFPFYLQKCVVHAPKPSQTANPVYRAVYVNNLLLCPQVLIKPPEYKYNDSTEQLKIKGYNIYLSRGEFMMNKDNLARVCMSKLNRISKPEITSTDDDTLIISMLTFICIVISLVCLLSTFLVYCVFKPLRTLPGLNNMCLILSLFFAQVMTLIRPHTLEFLFVALATSIALHYFWLCVFFWLHVCSFHMFRVFTGKIHTIKSEKGKRHTVIKYGTYAYGTPAFIVSSHLIVNLILSNGTLTGYENRNSLVSNKTAFIISIISPMMLICISNLIFFIVTVYRIRNTPHAQKNQQQSVDVWVYVKLFSLTGLTWIFQIVDAFLPLSFLSYVVAILNGLQGLFLFLSYVCNGRVFRLCCKEKTNNPSSNYSSGRMNLSIVSTKL